MTTERPCNTDTFSIVERVIDKLIQEETTISSNPTSLTNTGFSKISLLRKAKDKLLEALKEVKG